MLQACAYAKPPQYIRYVAPHVRSTNRVVVVISPPFKCAYAPHEPALLVTHVVTNKRNQSPAVRARSPEGTSRVANPPRTAISRLLKLLIFLRT